MTPTFLRKLLLSSLASATTLLAACGGGGSDNDDGGNTVNKPTAKISASQTRLPLGTAVTLDGSASSSPNGGTLSYAWELGPKPESSLAALTSTTASSTGFTPDRAGEYTATLVVNDGTASSNNASVVITATNPDPVAVIKSPEQAVLLNSTVTLDGSASQPPTDADPSKLRYEWTLVTQPGDGAVVELQNADQPIASFVASKIGEYKVRLVVTHGDKRSAPVDAVIKANVSNSSPVAVIKTDGEPAYLGNELELTGKVGKAVKLDGSDSYDPDGDTLHYRWRFNPGYAPRFKPAISSSSISNANQAIAEIIPDAVGRYRMQLVVYDQSVETIKDIVLTVSAASDTPDTAPVARINYGNDLECEHNGPYPYYQVCSVSSLGTGDVKDDTNLIYTWSWWNLETPGQKTTTTSASNYVGIPSTTAGKFGVSLVVKNSAGLSSAEAYQVLHIKAGANAVPETVASTEFARVMVNTTASLSAKGSTDANGDPLQYKWTWADRPDGSQATLVGDTSVEASFIPDQPGMYTAQLHVSDGKADAELKRDSFVSVFAKTKNNPPVGTLNTAPVTTNIISSVTAAPDQAICLECITQFFARLSDPDNDRPLYYLLTQTRHTGDPELAIASISGQTNGTIGELGFINRTFAKVPGNYEFRLLTSDGIDSHEHVYNFNVVKQNDYPSLLFVRATPEGEPTPYQLFFPYQRTAHTNVETAGEYGYVERYYLKAYDRDYTITDVKTTGKDGLVASFQGLEEGKVIRKGESVAVTLVRPLIPNELSLSQAERDAQVKSYGFSWSFRFKERNDFSVLVNH